jgi:hypothetical protein
MLVEDLLNDLQILNPEPMAAGEEVRAYLNQKAPALASLPPDNVPGILRAFGLVIETAPADDPVIRQAVPIAVQGALWCHTGVARFAWDLDRLPLGVPIADVNWVSTMILAHWLVHAPRMSEYEEASTWAAPHNPPSFLCAVDRRPVTVFERHAASFAAAFLLPADDLSITIRNNRSAQALRAAIADTGMVETIAEVFEVPPWVATYRLRDLCGSVEYRLRWLNS